MTQARPMLTALRSKLSGFGRASQLEQALPTLVQLLPPLLVQQAVSGLLNRLLAPALANNALPELQGRWLAIDCSELAYRIRISRTQTQLLVSTRVGPVDASIRGEAAAFLRLLRQDCDPDSLFFQRKLIMQGDTELALAVKNFLDSIDRDQLPAWLTTMLRR